MLQFRRGSWRRGKLLLEPRGQSHFEMTREEIERKKHLEEVWRGEEREEVSDVNYPSQSFPAPENKCKCGHGEKREEGTTNPTAILSNRTRAKTLQTKTTITAKEDVKCCDGAALDKMLFLLAVKIMQTIILGTI